MTDEPLSPRSPRYKSAFISHSGADKGIATELVKRLEAKACRCWISSRDIPPGADWDDQILLGLNKSEVVILVLTEAASKSEHVQREVFLAKTARKAVVPVRFGAFTLEPTNKLLFWLASGHFIDATTEAARLDEVVEHILRGTGQGDAPPELPTVKSSNSKPFIFAAGLTGLVVAGWFAYAQLGVGRRSAEDARKTDERTPQPLAGADHGGTQAPEASLKVQFLQEDGKTPLHGAIIPAFRQPNGNNADEHNGIKFSYRIQSIGGRIEKAGLTDVEYTAASSNQDRVTIPAGRIIIDASTIRTDGKGWGPALELPTGSVRTHYSRYLDLFPTPLGGSVSESGLGFIYVGKKGLFPPGPAAVHMTYRAEVGGPTLGEADFTVDVPPAPWPLDEKDAKLHLLNAEGTAALEAAPVATVHPVQAKTISKPLEAAKFWCVLQGGSEDVTGPVTIRHYLLNARFSDEPVRDPKEMVMDRSYGWQRVNLAQGSFIQLTARDFMAANDTLHAGEKRSPIPTLLDMGPGGSLPPGEHDVAVEMTRGDAVLYRQIIKVKVEPPNANDWALDEMQTKVRVLDKNGEPIESVTVPATREATYDWTDPKTNVRTLAYNGLKFELQLQGKTEPVPGPIGLTYYLKAVKAPAALSGGATMSIELGEGAPPFLTTPLPQGYTYVSSWGILAEGASVPATEPKLMPVLVFYAGIGKEGGSIPAGIHDVGLEVYTQGVVIYRGVLKLDVK